MTITGKRNHTIKKTDLANSRSAAVGFTKIVFFHKATAGDTTINLGALSMPSEISSAGYTNPSASELASFNLSLIRNNLKLVSSRGVELIPGLSYIASGLVITLSDSFGPALADEIFTGVIDPVAKTGANFVDASPLVATGLLAAGAQDFNVGQPFEVNKYPNAQAGAVLVFVDGDIQFRNVGNATADPGADGNYQELAATGGNLATIIRFNDVEAYDRNILVVSNGLLAERPSESVKAEVERLQGQIDSLVATTAVLAGVPESNFQAAPNAVDLKQFGDRVLGLEEPGSPGEPKLATASEAGAVPNYSTGSFTVTPINTTNITTSTFVSAFYEKVGPRVMIFMVISVDPVATGFTRLDFLKSELPFQPRTNAPIIGGFTRSGTDGGDAEQLNTGFVKARAGSANVGLEMTLDGATANNWQIDFSYFTD